MTALSEARMSSSTSGRLNRSLRVYEEPYPEMTKRADRSQFEERLRMLDNLIEEISEDDEEAAGVSDCSSPSLNLEGPSPYVLPIEDRLWHSMPRYQNMFMAHSVLSFKILRRSVKSCAHLERSFTQSAFLRKRSQFLFGVRRFGGSFDQLTVDFLNLPPIPEGVPQELCDEKTSKFEENETDCDECYECSDYSSTR